MFNLEDLQQLKETIEKHQFLSIDKEGFWVNRDLDCLSFEAIESFKQMCNIAISCEINLRIYPSGWWK